MRKALKGTLVLTSFLVSAFAAWTTQSKNHTKDQESDMFITENALALGESQPNLKHIVSHKVYKVTQKKICDVYDEKDKNKRIGMIVEFHLNIGWWQTCDKTSDPKYKTNCMNGVCTSEACAIAKGYQVEEPTGMTYDSPTFISLQ